MLIHNSHLVQSRTFVIRVCKIKLPSFELGRYTMKTETKPVNINDKCTAYIRELNNYLAERLCEAIVGNR